MQRVTFAIEIALAVITLYTAMLGVIICNFSEREAWFFMSVFVLFATSCTAGVVLAVVLFFLGGAS
jgi:hypothetical protein